MRDATKAKRLATVTLRIIAWLTVALLLLVAASAIALRTEAGKRFVASKVEGAINPTLAGAFIIDDLGEVSLDGRVEHANLRLLDETGRPVLIVLDASVDLDLSQLLGSLFGEGPLVVEMPSALVGYADLRLDVHDGQAAIGRALAPKEPQPTPAPSGGKPLFLTLESARIDRIWLHGGVDALDQVDAEVTDLSGSLEVTESSVDLDELRATWLARATTFGLPARGIIEGRARFPLEAESGPDARAHLAGTVAGSPFEVTAKIANMRYEATADIPYVERALLGRWTNAKTARATVQAEGNAEQVTIDLAAGLDDARLEAAVRLEFEPGRVEGSASAEDLDLASIAPGAPSSNVNADVNFSGRRVFEDDRQIQVRLDLAASMLDGTKIPPSRASATWTGRRVTGTARIDEPGAATKIDYDLRLTPGLDGLERARATAHVDLSGPRRIERLASVSSGSGHVDAKLDLDVSAQRADVEVTGQVANLSRDDVSVEHLGFDLQASGPIEALRIDGRATARGLNAQGRSVDRLTVRADGNQHALVVTARGESGTLDRFEASAVLDLAGEPTARDVTVRAERKGVQLAAHATTIGLGDELALDGLRAEGVGTLQASGRVTKDGFVIDGQADELRLDEIGRLIGVDGLDGRVSVEANLTLGGGRPTGTVSFEGRDLAYGKLSDVRARGNLDFDRATVSGTVVASADGDVVQVTASDLNYQRAVEWDDPLALSQIGGALEAHARLDLGRLETVLPDGTVPEGLDGTFVVSVRVAGRGSGLAPDVDFSVTGDAIDIPPGLGMPTPQGLDGWVRGRLDGQAESARLAVRVSDRQGLWVEAEGESQVPATLFATARAWQSAAFRRAPFDAALRLHPRRVSQLPAPISEALPLDGVLGGRLRATGNLESPKLFASTRLSDIDASSHTTQALDAVALASHADGVSRIRLSVSNSARPLADARVVVHGSPQALAKGEWTADGRARLSGLPLSQLAALSRYDLSGTAVGELTFEGLNAAPRAKGQIEIQDLRLGTSRFSSARAKVELSPDRFDAEARITQRNGAARSSFGARIESWDSAFAPEVDERQTEVRLEAQDLDPSFMLPFVSSSVSKLDGRVDADLRIRPGEKTPISGYIEWSDGVVQTPTLGQTLHDITMEARARGDRIEVTRLSGRGLQGTFSAKGYVRLEGVGFREARLGFQIPEDDPMPLTLEGVSYGRASGRASIQAKLDPDDNQMLVAVEVPRFELALADQGARSVQDLDPAPHIETGVYEERGEFRELPLQLVEEEPEETSATEQPLTVVVKIELGDDVRVTRANQLEARFTGNPTFEMRGSETRSSGKIEIVDGWLDVMGKRFVLEKGTVTFGDEPGNPIVVASARWESPEGTTVRATFRGPTDSGTLKLSSNPPMSDSSILSLLVLGTTEGTTAGTGSEESGGMASGAAAVGGGVITRGLDRALTSLTDLEISTRVDTSENTPRPEVMVRVTRRLAVELSYNPDTATPGGRQDHALLTFVFSLPKNWVIETTVGDAGTSILDFIWRHRY